MALQLFGPDMFRAFDRLWQQMDDTFRDGGTPGSLRSNWSSFPPLNIGSTEDSVEVVAFAPGMDPDSFEVTVDRSLLTISGERKNALEGMTEGATVYANERPSGKFRRVIELPRDCDLEQVDARYTDGCLCISVKKSEASKPRPIQIQ